MAGTTGAVQMMMRLIEKKKVSSSTAKLWINSLALIKNPTLEMVGAVIVSAFQL